MIICFQTIILIDSSFFIYTNGFGSEKVIRRVF